MSKCHQILTESRYINYLQLLYKQVVSASSPLVGFGELNDNTIKDLTSLRSVEQEIEFIA
jgi:hypothetical protein